MPTARGEEGAPVAPQNCADKFVCGSKIVKLIRLSAFQEYLNVAECLKGV